MQYSDSLGMVIRNRRHFRDVLKASQETSRPIQEYDPIKPRRLWGPRVRQRKSGLVERPDFPKDKGDPLVLPAVETRP